MKKKILSIMALWLALFALVFIYTDRDEYTWSFSGESLSHVLITGEQAAAREQAAQQAMAAEKTEAIARGQQGLWGKEDLYSGAPRTRPAVDEDLGLNLMWGEYDVHVICNAPPVLNMRAVSALRQSFISQGDISSPAGKNEFSFSICSRSCSIAIVSLSISISTKNPIISHKTALSTFAKSSPFL